MDTLIWLLLGCVLAHVTFGAPPAPACTGVTCDHCPGGIVDTPSRKCCPTCKPAVNKRCPSETTGVCPEVCSSQGDCGNQLCCDNGCGNVCKEPVRFEPGSPVCDYNDVTYEPGEKYMEGCLECTCQDDGTFLCFYQCA